MWTGRYSNVLVYFHVLVYVVNTPKLIKSKILESLVYLFWIAPGDKIPPSTILYQIYQFWDFFCKDLINVVTYVLSKNEGLVIFHLKIIQNLNYFQIWHFWLGWIGAALPAIQNHCLGLIFISVLFQSVPWKPLRPDKMFKN